MAQGKWFAISPASKSGGPLLLPTIAFAKSNFRIPTGWRVLRVAGPRSGTRLCEAQQAEQFSDAEITFGNQPGGKIPESPRLSYFEEINEDSAEASHQGCRAETNSKRAASWSAAKYRPPQDSAARVPAAEVRWSLPLARGSWTAALETVAVAELWGSHRSPPRSLHPCPSGGDATENWQHQELRSATPFALRRPRPRHEQGRPPAN
jgi:hypothetical protein